MEPKQLSYEGVFKEYLDAKAEYDEACHNFQQAALRRESTNKRLGALSEKISSIVNSGLNDPTVPQCAEVPMQKRWSGAAGQIG